MPAWQTVEPEGWVAGGARASVLSAAEQTPAAWELKSAFAIALIL